MSTTADTATAILPFHLEISDDELTELRRRITATRWPSTELVADRSQGVQLSPLQKLARFWVSGEPLMISWSLLPSGLISQIPPC